MNDKLKNRIIKYLISEYNDLDALKSKEYPDHIFFIKDDKVIFDYNKKNGVVYISYDKIWSFLSSFFELNNEEIRELTKEWVEEHYKLGVTTTIFTKRLGSIWVEEHYKLGVTTTMMWKR